MHIALSPFFLTPLLPPPHALQLLLLSDGSVTRHLQLLTGLAVEVDCLEMAAVDSSSSPDSHGSRGGGDSTCGGGPPLPAAAALIAGPLVQRQVLLRLPAPVEGAYVYAASWWAADTVDQYLRRAPPHGVLRAPCCAFNHATLIGGSQLLSHLHGIHTPACSSKNAQVDLLNVPV
jgi:hypothetical protein